MHAKLQVTNRKLYFFCISDVIVFKMIKVTMARVRKLIYLCSPKIEWFGAMSTGHLGALFISSLMTHIFIERTHTQKSKY